MAIVLYYIISYITRKMIFIMTGLILLQFNLRCLGWEFSEPEVLVYDMLIISWYIFLGLLYCENRLKCQFLPSSPVFYFNLVVAGWETKQNIYGSKTRISTMDSFGQYITLLFLLYFLSGPSASTEWILAVKAKSNIKMEFLGYPIFVGPF